MPAFGPARPRKSAPGGALVRSRAVATRSERAHGRAAFAKDRSVTASDGTRIAYTVRGDGPGIPVVFVNGWSCTDAYWARVGPKVGAGGHETVYLDLRGHGESGLPRAPGIAARGLLPEDVSPARLATDVVEVLNGAGIERAALVGHSMGVQVVVEACRVAPERVAGLVAVAGTFENPVRTFADQPLFDRLYGLADLAFPYVPLEVARPIVRRLGFPGLARRLALGTKMAGPKVQADDLAPHLTHMGEVNLSVLFKMMGELRRHSADAFLGAIAVPALILAGRLDRVTPPRVQEAMAARIPDAELVWFEDAGHLLPVEDPEGVASSIADFLARRVDGPPKVSAN